MTALSTPPGRTETTPTAVIPYLAVDGAASALDFYARAFGAVETFRLPEGDRIGHAEFTIGEAKFYLSDEWRQMNVLSPKSLGGYSVSLAIQVPDTDAFVAHLSECGVTVERGVDDGPEEGYRHAWVVDPYGHRWHISGPRPA
ncbi:VOC family protein [Microlunatus elymi]|nr:VOC family protein [Microlunatus elymi]